MKHRAVIAKNRLRTDVCARCGKPVELNADKRLVHKGDAK